MPTIRVEGGQLTAKQKDLLIQRLTEVAAEMMHVPQKFFMMTVQELPDDNIGIGGKTIDKVKREYLGKRKP